MTPDRRAEAPRTLVIGLGGGGTAAARGLAAHWPDGPRVLLVDTDGRTLANAGGLDALQIGAHVIKGLGTGGEPRMGLRAAQSDAVSLQACVRDQQLVLILVGLGGGTGTGAAPLLAETAREAGALTLCFAMLPFEFEGARRMDHARRGLNSLQTAADAVLCLPNQRLIEQLGDRTNIGEAFRLADATLGRGVQAVWRTISRPGAIGLSLADVCALVRRGHGRGVFETLEGTGPDKTESLLEGIRRSALLGHGAVLAGADGFLVSLMGCADVSLKDIDRLMKGILAAANPAALALTGVCCEAEPGDRLTATFLVMEPDGTPRAPGEDAPSPGTPAAPAATPPKEVPQDLFPVQPDRFLGIEPTIVNGTDLDKPTFQRRNLVIQKLSRTGPD